MIKEKFEYNFDIDPFNEEDWDELEPDGTFLTWLKINYPNEGIWKDIKIINCNNKNLTDLIGIEKLINLKYLYCHRNELKELNISNNIKLNGLYCHNNQLTELNVTKNIKLEELNCYHNQLTELDVTKNIKLIYLHCRNNQLIELGVTNNIRLMNFYCNNNQLTELDVTNNINLIGLNCSNNQLTELDVTKNNLIVVRKSKFSFRRFLKKVNKFNSKLFNYFIMIRNGADFS